MANSSNEKLVAINFQRIKHWMAMGAGLSTPVAQLLGLAGFLPIHPGSNKYFDLQYAFKSISTVIKTFLETVIGAWKNRAAPPPKEDAKVEVFHGVAPPPMNPKLL